MLMVLRHRPRLRCARVRLVFTVCTLSSVLSFYVTWLQMLVYKAGVVQDGQMTAYLRGLTVEEKLCRKDSSSTPYSFSLFFNTCNVNIQPLLRQTHHLALNFTCDLGVKANTSKEMDTTKQNINSTESARLTRLSAGMREAEDILHSVNRTNCEKYLAVPSDSLPLAVPFKHPCLQKYIAGNCRGQHSVPRIVHYVWFSEHTMDLVTFLSVLAAYRFLDPCLILFHSDSLPLGAHWKALVALVPVLVRVQRVAPSVVFGRKLGAVQHKSDIARLEALKEYGGIYLDGDHIVLKDLKEYLDYEFVMGHENRHNLANSLLISAPNAKFIDVWYRNYRSYNPRQWGIHSTFLPLALSKIYPKMIHNAGYAFIKPDLPGIREVWEGQYDWSQNHAIHLYYRSMVEGKEVRTNYTLSELTRLNSSLGEIARHVLFGDKNACRGDRRLPGESTLT